MNMDRHHMRTLEAHRHQRGAAYQRGVIAGFVLGALACASAWAFTAFMGGL